MARLRVGLIGCGRIAERGYLPALCRVEGLRLAAVADPVAARCARIAPDLPCFAGASELLAATAADVLVLATPAVSHLADARLAAEAGVHVLIEKPPARTAEEAEELTLLEPPPWIGFNRRFEPGVVALREAARGVTPLELSLRLRARKSSWRSYEADDDLLLDLGPHLVDLALWISAGEPTVVAARIDGDRAVLELDLGHRSAARIECGSGPYLERLEVRAAGKALAHHERGGLRQALRSILLGAESPLVPTLAAQLDSFSRAVQGATEPWLATAQDGLRVMRILATARSAGKST